ncbi:phosphoglycerate mutase family protein, partial [Ramlibacter sp. 2FC]|uniref:SixA phosphatase family protein n=1 Tax=Ramlibacter sp. 2FC TaxID=2502188 RepID=UPI0010F71139
MGTLYLVRHGQASFGADDYDQLSELGQRQSLRLGEYFRSRGLVFDAVLTGTLRRQVQTWEGIAQGLQARPPA